jgi:hypothetical protein
MHVAQPISCGATNAQHRDWHFMCVRRRSSLYSQLVRCHQCIA